MAKTKFSAEFTVKAHQMILKGLEPKQIQKRMSLTRREWAMLSGQKLFHELIRKTPMDYIKDLEKELFRLIGIYKVSTPVEREKMNPKIQEMTKAYAEFVL